MTSIATLLHAARRRAITVTAFLLAAVIAVALITVMTGKYPLSVPEFFGVIAGQGNALDQYIVFGVRLPRLLLGVLAGASLGLAGALFQSLLLNPLASPDLLGISGGAATAAIIATLILGWAGPLVTLAAFGGAFLIAALIIAASRSGTGSGHRLILTGVGFAFLTSAVIGFIIKRAQINEAQSALFWTIGSVANSSWTSVTLVGVTLIVALPAVIYASRVLPIIQMGPASAVSLGVHDARARRILVVTAVLLASGAVAVVGPISFVALCAPAVARRAIGYGTAALTASACAGALMLTASDLAAQNLFGGAVPTGVITGAIGAPYLLWLLGSSTKGHSL
ncbi:FecCD family ABC transporter permease [Jonesia quinghaiensis]|uniref:FecCD family ABC transporter permease n=1 Tax=Jonesia quinghaiensis TaxID=262806 RepID=UPI000426F7B5|nr:iron chelate uptake ABC transporter family permease subunit [Jonesia quinghaiensis]